MVGSLGSHCQEWRGSTKRQLKGNRSSRVGWSEAGTLRGGTDGTTKGKARWNKVGQQKRCGTNTRLYKPYSFNQGRKTIDDSRLRQPFVMSWGSLASGEWGLLLPRGGSTPLILASGALAFIFSLYHFFNFLLVFVLDLINLPISLSQTRQYCPKATILLYLRCPSY